MNNEKKAIELLERWAAYWSLSPTTSGNPAVYAETVRFLKEHQDADNKAKAAAIIKRILAEAGYVELLRESVMVNEMAVILKEMRDEK